jgi:hypothetical protein
MSAPEKRWILDYWYRVLGKVNHRLSDEQRHQAAMPAIEEIRKLQHPLTGEDRTYKTRRDELKKWLSALAQIPGGASREDMREVWRLTLSILYSSPYITENYPTESTEVISLLPVVDARSPIEMLKWPTLEARSIESVLMVLETQNKQSFRNDIWQAARWAQSNRCNVTSPPTRP